MTSHYTNIIFVAYLLLCLFITSATAHSYIRQFTMMMHWTQIRNEAIQNLDVHDLHEYQEISSRDYKASSVSSTVKGLRIRSPSSYSIKMESFNALSKSTFAQIYRSRPFTVGKHNWTLVVYPNGNKKDSGSGYLSLYVAIDSSTLAEHQEVNADLRFYVFNKNQRKYFTIQDTDVWQFSAFKSMWGFSQVLPIDTFKDPKNGYFYDGDHCEFGVDVTIPSLKKNSELFSVTETFSDPKFTWTIRKFSTLLKKSYLSDVFTIGKRRWNIKVYPNGMTADGKYMSMYLKLNETLKPYEKIFVRAKLRVLNQRQLNSVNYQLDVWYRGSGYGSKAKNSWGTDTIISQASLRDSSKGFVVNDMLKVQIEMETISSTKYLPS